MKRSIRSIAVIAAAALVTTAFTINTNPELEIGASLPKGDLRMKDVVSGKDVALNDVNGENGLLVIFSCNTCPYVKLSESRISEAALQARRGKIGVIIVNSNEAQRDEEDSPESMKKYSDEQKFDFPYVVDVNSELADAFGATRTPHVFLFNGKGKLVYKGAIDDNIKDDKGVKERYLRDALTAVSRGSEVKVASTKSIGCTIKRKE
jgi:peroxiredoxin